MTDVVTTKIAEAYRVLYKDLVGFLRGKMRGESPEMAQDIAHDTFAYWIKHQHTVDVAHPKAYLTQVASNLLRDHWRHQKVRQHETSLDITFTEGDDAGSLAVQEPAMSSAMQPERQLECRQRLMLLQQAIDTLPPRQQEAFLLRKLHHLSNAQIAEKMGVSVRMIEQHLHSAMLHCRRHVYKDTTSPEGVYE
jgi:RNA polymerase sigma factor (sigma-70 family)